MQVNLTGAHIKNMCQLNAYVVASQDEVLMAQLSNTLHPYHALYGALINLQTSYYLHVSGIQFSHFDASGLYTVVPGSVKIYNGLYFIC